MTHENPAFVGDDGRSCNGKSDQHKGFAQQQSPNLSKVVDTPPGEIDPSKKTSPERDNWGKDIEFLFSCIAMSVGLGNVWRFPFTALENGGGAFLIPYLIVLFLVGKPIYYLEMIIGQFSSRGSVKVFDLCPAMRGVGVGQVMSISTVGTYYVAIMGITLKYLVESFKSVLPWTYCRDSWNANCVASNETNTASIIFSDTSNLVNNITSSNNISAPTDRPTPSAELYFLNEVLREKYNIEDGIGLPNWQLAIALFISWLSVCLILIRGVKSSGKASYFLALFPYCVMAILLIRAVTLPGSLDGIIYFIRPQWDQLLNPKVWYAAVTQVFYSLSVCFGNIIMYSSYNRFGHNVHRDATIVTLLDTFTSLLAGFTIFGILGHLAHEIGTSDIGSVVKGGTGLAFISYPDAIAKFKTLPQAFSVLFFLMLFVLGIGTNIAMTSCAITSIRDNFPKIKHTHCAMGIAIVSFCIGLIYITPGGQFMLTLVDYFGASMLALILGIVELYVLGWVYGVDRLCKDVEFMMGRKVGLYWRLCWSIITPVIMSLILIYFLATYEPLSYNDVLYPKWAYAIGWTITAFGVMQLPLWFCIAVIRTPGDTLMQRIRGSFRPKADWGPRDLLLREQYNKQIDNDRISTNQLGFWGSIKKNIFS